MPLYQFSQIPSALKAQKLRDNSSVAFIFCETSDLIDETIKYLNKRNFACICLFISEPEQYREKEGVLNFKYEFTDWPDIWRAINVAIPILRHKWLYWGLNGEFLYYPFCENRDINDLSDFLAGERRNILSGSVIDLYPGDIETHSAGYSMTNTYFDRANYYATPTDWDEDNFEEGELERIKFIYGGLRWRFGEFIPKNRRRIDRVPYFFIDERLNFDENGFTKRPEFFTYRCQHHHNTTCAVMSFHMARFLRFEPETRDKIHDFMWRGSLRFRWNSPQLLRLGFIETGQWF